MEIFIEKNSEEASKKASAIIKNLVCAKPNAVLGLATGSTPLPLYSFLIENFKRNELSFANVKTFNLDEYIGLDFEDTNSYHSYMLENFFNHIDIDLSNVNIPNGLAKDLNVACTDYDAKIKAAGGIDLQLLGLGSDGHIGFNEPGVDFNSRTRVECLTAKTIEDNSRFFEDISKVPTKAITMGVASIMEAKEIVLLAFGKSKAEAVSKMVNGCVSSDLPASILQKHPNVKVFLDEEAAWLL